MLRGSKIQNNLIAIEKNLYAIDAATKTAILKDTNTVNTIIVKESYAINRSLAELQSMSDDDVIKPLINNLSSLVKRKSDYFHNLVQRVNSGSDGRSSISFDSNAGSRLSDSISTTIQKIIYANELNKTEFAIKAETQGRKARNLGLSLAIIAIIASTVTFAYIAIKVRQQNRLIKRLNESENKARQLAKIKENFLANMSHEIRTPLNAIIGFAQLLKTQNLSGDSRVFTGSILKSSEHLLYIINDILDLSKLEAGVMRINNAPFDFVTFFNHLKDVYTARADEKGLKLVALSDAQIPTIIYGDEMRLAQVLNNLLTNAIKFTDTGQIFFNAICTNKNEEKVWLQMTIQDTGIGIAEEQLFNIFNRFHQVYEDSTRNYNGAGLGLTIAKDIVGIMGGKIEVKSKVGMGSSFIVTIPFNYYREQSEHKFEHIDDQAGKPTVLPNRKKILVAEDNPVNQLLIKHWLDRWQYLYTIVANGVGAVEALKEEEFDLVLLDLQMPVMDGYTCAGIIRKELKKALPIIAITAHAITDEIPKCKKAGIDDVITKPFDIQLLERKLRNYFNLDGESDSSPDIYENSKFNTIDISYLHQLCMGDKEYEMKMIEVFKAKLKIHLDQMAGYLSSGNIQFFQKELHSLKSTVGILGQNDDLKKEIKHLETSTFGERFTLSFEKMKSLLTKAEIELEEYVRLIQV